MNKKLFLPIEIKKREFDSKMLFAFFALEKNMEIYIGRQPEILKGMIFFRKSIFFEKGLTILNLKQIEYLDHLGHNIVATCEEGLIFNNEEFYLKRRISKKALDLIEIFFSWGSKQAKLIQNYSKDNKKKIKETGNPRIDLLDDKMLELKSSEVIKIKKKYKKFILINSNFSIYNNTNGKKFYLEEMIWARGDVDISHEKECREFYNYQMHNFYEYLELAEKLLTDFKNYKIVIRPHPSESFLEWKKIVSKFPDRIFLKSDYSFIPWAIAADFVIQCRCMTGLESFLIQKNKVINYEPFKLSHSKNILNYIGFQCSSYEKVKSIIKNKPKNYLEAKSKINNLISFNSEPSASIIINAINTHKFKVKKTNFTFVIALVLTRLKNKFVSLFRKKIDDPWDKKFRSISVNEVNLSLSKISKLFKSKSKFRVTKSFFSDKCVKIKKI